MSTNQPSNPPNRHQDAYVSADDADDFEYEIEPPDADVVLAAQRRAEEDLATAERVIDVDAVYRDLDNREGRDGAWEPGDLRFSLKHLLIGTTAVGVLLGIWSAGLLSGQLFACFIGVSLVTLGGIHAFLDWRERRRREALVAQRRYELARARGDFDGDAPPAFAADFADLRQELREFLRFGVRELLIATAVAALLLVLVRLVGVGGAAALVGLVALGGLALQAMDYELHRGVVVAWWVSILAFCLLLLGDLASSALGFG